jgi:hypothetical protein
VNPTVLAALNEQKIGLLRLVDTPVEPFGYGVDLSCVLDVTEDLAEVDSFSPIAIAESSLRRLITPRGGCPDDSDYGFDLRGQLNKGVTVLGLRTLSGQSRAEINKDDRVSDCTADVTYDSVQGPQLRVKVTIQPVDVDLGEFTFTGSINDTRAVLEAIS